MNVSDGEIDRDRHDAYLSILGTKAGPLKAAMFLMGSAAGKAGSSLTPADFAMATEAMEQVRDSAAAFLDQLAATRCPEYLRGADSQVQDALKLMADGAQRGANAARARDGARLSSAAAEIEVANRDIAGAGALLATWRSGAARP